MKQPIHPSSTMDPQRFARQQCPQMHMYIEHVCMDSGQCMHLIFGTTQNQIQIHIYLYVLCICLQD